MVVGSVKDLKPASLMCVRRMGVLCGGNRKKGGILTEMRDAGAGCVAFVVGRDEGACAASGGLCVVEMVWGWTALPFC